MSGAERHRAPEAGPHDSVVRLLRRILPADARGGVLLDLACGDAAIAEIVEREFGVHYVGLDADPAAVATATADGHAVTVADLGEPDGLRDVLAEAVGEGRVVAVTMLDGLGHLARGVDVLREVGLFIRDRGASLVLGVPNTTHRDIGFKLAFGAWNYTRRGLLDVRYVHLYGEEELEETLAAAGLHRTAREDFVRSDSDQHFPGDHPALTRGTSLNHWMSSLRDQAGGNARVDRFIWAALPGPVPNGRPDDEAERPFLTVLVRTQARRPQQLAEVLSCLAGQTDQDFEVVLVAHHVGATARAELERLIERQPPSLARRVRYLPVDHGSRATLLNEGFDAARGDYVVALDDDDVVFAHWVAAFRTVSQKHPGKVLRSIGTLQAADVVRTRGHWAVRTEGPIQRPYDQEFSMVRHLVLNQTPFMTAAFPRGLYTSLGLRFDETLTTSEDWDFLLRSASLVGVADSLQLTAIYHTWVSQDGSRTEHDIEEWKLNEYSIDRKIDALPLLLPIGETRRIRELVRLADRPEPEPVPPVVDHDERFALTQRLLTLLESRSWRVSAPLRGVSRLTGRTGPLRASVLLDPNVDEQTIREAIDAILTSRSWRSTRLLRRSGA